MPYVLEGDIARPFPNTLDTTLTLEDAAAEAKATGEAIQKAKTEAMQHADSHSKDAENPHKVNKTHVGLGKVDNTSDMEKPVSIAQANAINAVSDQVAAVNRDKAETKSFFGTLMASEWTEDAPYTQEFNVSGIMEKDEPFVDVDLSEVEDVLSAIEAWGMVGRCVASADNMVTAYCYQEKPAVDIPLKFKVVR